MAKRLRVFLIFSRKLFILPEGKVLVKDPQARMYANEFYIIAA
jgi:hypothetical protein